MGWKLGKKNLKKRKNKVYYIANANNGKVSTYKTKKYAQKFIRRNKGGKIITYKPNSNKKFS